MSELRSFKSWIEDFIRIKAEEPTHFTEPVIAVVSQQTRFWDVPPSATVQDLQKIAKEHINSLLLEGKIVRSTVKGKMIGRYVWHEASLASTQPALPAPVVPGYTLDSKESRNGTDAEYEDVLRAISDYFLSAEPKVWSFRDAINLHDDRCRQLGLIFKNRMESVEQYFIRLSQAGQLFVPYSRKVPMADIRGRDREWGVLKAGVPLPIVDYERGWRESSPLPLPQEIIKKRRKLPTTERKS